MEKKISDLPSSGFCAAVTMTMTMEDPMKNEDGSFSLSLFGHGAGKEEELAPAIGFVPSGLQAEAICLLGTEEVTCRRTSSGMAMGNLSEEGLNCLSLRSNNSGIMAFEITGKLHRIFPIEEKSSSFRTRDIVLEVQDGNFMQYVKFQLTQDRCALADAFREGEEVRVSFNLRGREWQGKYFTNLDAWRIEAVQAGASAMGASNDDPFAGVPFPESVPEATGSDQGVDDDLPF